MQEEPGVWWVSWLVTSALFLEGPRQYGQGEDEVTLRDRVERPLWSSHMAHALPSSIRDKRARRPSVQTFPCIAPAALAPANEVFWRAVKDH